MKEPGKITKYLKRMSNGLQLILLLAVTVGISLLFYSNPTISNANSNYLLNRTVDGMNSTPYSGIGGGSINGNCMYGKKALPIYSVSTDSKYISLSFDAAWGAEDTIQILDTLDKCNVKATFFMTGGWVNSFPDMVKEIYNRGHDLGNHSQNHKHMSKLSVSEQQEEISKVTESVKKLTGYTMFLFRPPYGDYDTTLVKTTYGCNYYPIQWSVDSLDWKDYGVDSIIKTVTKHKNMKPGAIILMHNGAKYTAAALETTIETLKSQGYEFVPLSKLIIRENFHMNVNGEQVAD